MKKYTKYLVLFSLILGLSMPISAEEKSLNWKKEGSTWYAYDNSSKLTGWVSDTSKCWYFLDYQSGAMQTGWKAGDATHWYYFNPLNGIMQTGWQTIDGNKYYFETSGYYAGAMVTGTVEIAGVFQEFNSNGVYAGKSSENAASSNLSETEILEKQEKIYKETFYVTYRDYMKTDKLNLLFANRFDKTTTAFLPLGTYESKYYSIGKKFSNTYPNQEFYNMLIEISWDIGYIGSSQNSVKESNQKLLFKFDLDNNVLTLYRLIDDFDMNYNYGPYLNYSSLAYSLHLDTGLQVVTDVENKQYCIYNADNNDKYECYKGMNMEIFNDEMETPEEYKNKLFSTKTTNNDYLDEKQEIDTYIGILLNYLN